MIPAGYYHVPSTDSRAEVSKAATSASPSPPPERRAVSASPQGVLRIHFLEAQDLEGKDTFLGGLIKGKSDPYGVLQIGNQVFHSKVVKESLNPKWNEVYEVTSLGFPLWSMDRWSLCTLSKTNNNGQLESISISLSPLGSGVRALGSAP